MRREWTTRTTCRALATTLWLVLVPACFGHRFDGGSDASDATNDTVVVDAATGAEAGPEVIQPPTSVTIQPAEPTDEAPFLKCVFTAAEPGLQPAFRWYLDGAELDGQHAAELSNGLFQPADVIACGVRLSDGERSSEETRSGPIRIRGMVLINVGMGSLAFHPNFVVLDTAGQPSRLVLWLSHLLGHPFGYYGVGVQRRLSSDGLSWVSASATEGLMVPVGDPPVHEHRGPRAVLREGSTYHAWGLCNGPTCKGVRYYTSSDGLDWSHEGDELLTDLSFISVVKHDGMFHMWGRPVQGGALRHLTSASPSSGWPQAKQSAQVTLDGQSLQAVARVQLAASGSGGVFEMHHLDVEGVIVQSSSVAADATIFATDGPLLKTKPVLEKEEEIKDFQVVHVGDATYVYLGIGPAGLLTSDDWAMRLAVYVL